MDIIIISQDGKYLSKVNSVAVGVGEDSRKVYVLCVNGDVIEFGDYISPERAQSVIRHIFEQIKRVKSCDDAPALLYDMPNR